MPTFNISINADLVELMNHEMQTKRYGNRSEFFRDVLRRRYFQDDVVIERVAPSDPDYKLVQRRKKTAKGWVPLRKMIKKINKQ